MLSAMFEARVQLSCVAALALLSAAPAHAQDEEASARAAAQVEFTAGREAFARGEYEAALIRLRTAQELAPHDVVRFNIALCLERLDRIPEAVRELEALAESEQLGATERARARARLDVLRRRVGRVVLEPAGAQLRVEGRAPCEGPCEAIVAPGSHRVWVRGPDGEESDSVVEITAGQRVTVTPVERPEPPPPEAHPSPEPPPAEGFGLTPLGVVGAGIGAAGLAASIALGVHATSLHDAYVASSGSEGNVALRADGLLFRDLTNAAIGVAIGGAVLLAVDLIWALTR